MNSTDQEFLPPDFPREIKRKVFTPNREKCQTHKQVALAPYLRATMTKIWIKMPTLHQPEKPCIQSVCWLQQEPQCRCQMWRYQAGGPRPRLWGAKSFLDFLILIIVYLEFHDTHSQLQNREREVWTQAKGNSERQSIIRSNTGYSKPALKRQLNR